MPNLSLCYWVRGQLLDLWYIVEVSPHTTIRMLKELIVQKSPTLSQCDPVSLKVYKAPQDKPVLEDDALEYNLGNLSISMLGTPLRAGKALSSIFTSLPKDQLHLIIDVPTMEVRCWLWLRGADRRTRSLVRVSNADEVDHLKRIIRDEEPDLADIPMSRLRLYKISLKDDELAECLSATGVGELMDEDCLVRTVFDDVPFSAMPRVVVEWLDERLTKPPPSAYRSTGSGNPIKDARAEFLTASANEKDKTPSGAAKPSSFRKRQRDPTKCIPCGRPRADEETIPPMLLHPVFGDFVDNCQTIEITPDDYYFANDLANEMSLLYDDEATRFAAVEKTFQRYGIHFTVSKVKNTKYEVDADISINGHRYLIAEFKNEVGNTSAEPYFEAIVYYLESTRDTAVKFPWSPLPCFLLAIPGPYIVFAGATWNLRPSVQVLSTPIALCFHSSDTQNQLTVARHLAAFRKAIQTLKEYYDTQLKAGHPTTIPAPLHLFPHPTKYKFHDKEIDIHYEREQDEDKLVFFGTERGDGDRVDPICIKFVRTYSREAHDYFASLGCAPALRGFERLSGGWIMVIMDRLSDDFETLSDRTSPLPTSVFADMSAKLGEFHNANYVHGDIRDVNIMVSKSDEKQFMIVDFDWAGKKGEALYPDHVNHHGITRPADAQFGKEILATHDLFMLEHITQSRSKN